jgi:FtsH-binding integral membrane protein
MNKETSMYQKLAVALMFVAVFCTLFALTLANLNEIKPLAIVTGVSVGLSLWLLNWGEKK